MKTESSEHKPIENVNDIKALLTSEVEDKLVVYISEP
jgi:hypothetical protein